MDTTADKLFGLSVKQQREGWGWTMTEFANRLNAAGLENFHPATIGRLERGERPVRLQEAVVISRVLGEELSNLVAQTADAAQGSRVSNLWQEISFASYSLPRPIFDYFSKLVELEKLLQERPDLGRHLEIYDDDGPVDPDQFLSLYADFIEREWVAVEWMLEAPSRRAGEEMVRALSAVAQKLVIAESEDGSKNYVDLRGLSYGNKVDNGLDQETP